MKYLLLITAILFIGCNVQKREIEKQHYLNFRRPNILAEDYNTLFPSKPDSIGKIVYADNTADKKRIDSLVNALSIASTSFTIDTTICDTAALFKHYLTALNDNKKLRQALTDITKAYKNKRPDTIPVYLKKCPEIPLLKTQLQVKSDSLVVVKTQLSETEDTLNIWRWIAIGALISIVGYSAIKAYKFFTGGAIKSLIK